MMFIGSLEIALVVMTVIVVAFGIASVSRVPVRRHDPHRERRQRAILRREAQRSRFSDWR